MAIKRRAYICSSNSTSSLPQTSVKLAWRAWTGPSEMDHVLIAFKGHTASGKIQHLFGRFRRMVWRIGLVQGEYHRTEELHLALLRFVAEPNPLAFPFRKLKACRPVRRRQARLVVKGHMAGCDMHKP